MSQQIIKQPNGQYAIFSSVVDDFIVLDATPAEIIDHWTNAERERITERVTKIVAALDAGDKPYHQFTMSWQEAQDAAISRKKAEGAQGVSR